MHLNTFRRHCLQFNEQKIVAKHHLSPSRPLSHQMTEKVNEHKKDMTRKFHYFPIKARSLGNSFLSQDIHYSLVIVDEFQAGRANPKSDNRFNTFAEADKNAGRERERENQNENETQEVFPRDQLADCQVFIPSLSLLLVSLLPFLSINWRTLIVTK